MVTTFTPIHTRSVDMMALLWFETVPTGHAAIGSISPSFTCCNCTNKKNRSLLSKAYTFLMMADSGKIFENTYLKKTEQNCMNNSLFVTISIWEIDILHVLHLLAV